MSEKQSLLSNDDKETEKASSCHGCRIDVRMIPSKLCFFLVDSSHVLHSVYLVVFLTSIGLTVEEASLITGCSLTLAMIAGPIWGYLADHTGRNDIIFLILVMGTSIHFASPWLAASYPVTLDISNATSAVQIHTKPFTSSLFYIMLAIQCVVTAFMNPIQGFEISFVMNIIKSSDKEIEYGRQNLFGSIGITVTSVIAGIVVKHYSSSTLSPYTPVFYIHLALCLLLAPCGLITAHQATTKTIKDDSKTHSSRLKLLRSVYSFKNLVFMMTVIISGICTCTMSTFLFQLMSDQMQGSKLAMGLSVMVAASGENIMFLLSKQALKLFGGPINCMIASIFSSFLRFLLVAFIENDWLVLPTQILHGFSFAVFFISATEYTYSIAHEEIHSTLFNILVSLHSNIGGIFGTLVAGVIYNDYGGKFLFLAVAGLTGSWLIFMILYFHIYDKHCTKTKNGINTNDVKRNP